MSATTSALGNLKLICDAAMAEVTDLGYGITLWDDRFTVNGLKASVLYSVEQVMYADGSLAQGEKLSASAAAEWLKIAIPSFKVVAFVPYGGTDEDTVHYIGLVPRSQQMRDAGKLIASGGAVVIGVKRPARGSFRSQAPQQQNPNSGV